MSYLVICAVAFLASGLTFFSGFGLGTLLLPAFALFFAIGQAVALTAVVHFLNGVFKLVLVGRHIDRAVVLRFGVPAIAGAFAGAWLLVWLSGSGAWVTYTLFGRTMELAPAKLIVGLMLLFFACAEMLPWFRSVSFPSRYQPLGGLLSGFFGGLAGMQGALRSAFLIKAGLAKEAYVATGAAIAFLIDVSRLTVYSRLILEQRAGLDHGVLAAAIVAALLGSVLGNHYLPKATIRGMQAIVAVMLFAVALGLITGLL
ncbi:MAG TPA: sulfite exporter TauE/SafE family protein [Gemmatimonadales bacterium]|nr:sulfite exporter TauE/SafE family protein [Gemmatimonadales bacterium]